ncbi:hypothetical protein IMX07_00870 [bacterium]|nr:hypothetical protein [bacterium]
MADQQFALEAIIGAQTEQMESALSRLVTAINDTSTALESKLGAAAQKAGASLDKIQENAEAGGQGVAEAFDKMREGAMHFIEVLGVIEGLRWAKETIGEALEAGEALRNLSLETGISTQHIQELQFAAAATGASTDQLVMFTQRLTRAYIQLQTSSSQTGLAAVLQSAGLRPADLQDSYTALLKISDAINRMGESSARSRELLTELGGRSAAQLAPAIAKFEEFSAQAQQMGLILNDQTIAALEHAQEQFNILGFVINVDKERLAAAFAPALQVVAQLLTDLAERVNVLAQGDGMKRFAVAAANEVINLSESILTATQDLVQFGEELARIGSELESFKTEVSAAIRGVFAPIEALEDAGEAVGGVIGKSINAGIHGHLPSGADLAATIKTAFGAGVSAAAPSDMFAAERKQLEALRAEITETASSMKEVSGVDTGGGGGAAAPLTSSHLLEQQARKHQQLLQQQLEAFTEEQAVEVAVAGDTAAAKVAADQKVYEKAVELFGAQSKQAERAAVAELSARRQEMQQTEQLYAAQVSQQESIQQGQFAVEKAQVAQAAALHKISREQELQDDLAIAAQEEAARQSMYDKLAALYQNDAKQHQQALAEKAKAELQYEQQVIQLQTQLAETEQKQQTATANKLQSAFQTAFESLNSAGKGWLSVGESIFQKMLSQFEGMLAKMLADWIANSAAMQAVETGFHSALSWGEGLFGLGSVSAPGSPAPGGQGPVPVPAAATAQGAASAPLNATMNSMLAPLTLLAGGVQKLEVVMAMLNGTMLQHAATMLEHMAQVVLNTLTTDLNTLATDALTIASYVEAGAHFLFGAEGGIVPSAAGGMVARGYGKAFPAVLHAREMVLPAHISEGIQESLNWGRGLGGGAAAGASVHISFGDISAMDAEGMDRVLSEHGPRIAQTVVDHLGRMGGRFGN